MGVVCVAMKPGRPAVFRYGRSWLARPDAIGLYDMPPGDEPIYPPNYMVLHGALRDVLLDALGAAGLRFILGFRMIKATRSTNGTRQHHQTAMTTISGT